MALSNCGRFGRGNTTSRVPPTSRDPLPFLKKATRCGEAPKQQQPPDGPLENSENSRLTFFHADFGKEFPSRTLWRGASRSCPSPSSALYPFLYRTEHFSRGRKGRKGAEKRGGRGVANKGAKRKKGRAKTGQEKAVAVCCGRL